MDETIRIPKSYRFTAATIDAIGRLRTMWNLKSDTQALEEAVHRSLEGEMPASGPVLMAKFIASEDALDDYFVKTGEVLPVPTEIPVPVKELDETSRRILVDCTRRTRHGFDLMALRIPHVGPGLEPGEPTPCSHIYFFPGRIPTSIEDWKEFLLDVQEHHVELVAEWTARFAEQAKDALDRMKAAIMRGNVEDDLYAIFGEDEGRWYAREENFTIFLVYEPELGRLHETYRQARKQLLDAGWKSHHETEAQARQHVAAWIRQFGSAKLKRLFTSGFAYYERYAQERLDRENPGFVVIAEGDPLVFKESDDPQTEAFMWATRLGGSAGRLYHWESNFAEEEEELTLLGEVVYIRNPVPGIMAYKLVAPEPDALEDPRFERYLTPRVIV